MWSRAWARSNVCEPSPFSNKTIMLICTCEQWTLNIEGSMDIDCIKCIKFSVNSTLMRTSAKCSNLQPKENCVTAIVIVVTWSEIERSSYLWEGDKWSLHRVLPVTSSQTTEAPYLVPSAEYVQPDMHAMFYSLGWYCAIHWSPYLKNFLYYFSSLFLTGHIVLRTHDIEGTMKHPPGKGKVFQF